MPLSRRSIDQEIPSFDESELTAAMHVDTRRTVGVTAALLLMLGAQAHAGTVTCNDQVGALRAMLADHPDKDARGQLKEAERLCREGREAEAREMMSRARASIAAQAGAPGTRPASSCPSTNECR